MVKAVSPLVFNADLKTQAALTQVDESLFLFLFFKSVKRENVFSRSAFKYGSDLIAFTNDFKLGYLGMLLH